MSKLLDIFDVIITIGKETASDKHTRVDEKIEFLDDFMFSKYFFPRLFLCR